jgi:hypothetical protein
MRALLGGTRVIKRMAAIAMAFAVVATSACGKDDKNPTGNNNTNIGTYSLDKVDGAGLPATLFDGMIDIDGTVVQLKIEVTGGSMTLAANNTFTGSMALRLTAPGAPAQTETIPVSGTYTISGNSITMTSSDPEDPQVTGTISNGALVVSIDLLETGEDFSLSYKK